MDTLVSQLMIEHVFGLAYQETKDYLLILFNLYRILIF